MSYALCYQNVYDDTISQSGILELFVAFENTHMLWMRFSCFIIISSLLLQLFKLKYETFLVNFRILSWIVFS